MIENDTFVGDVDVADRLPRRAAVARLAGGAAAGLLASVVFAGGSSRIVAAQAATPPADAGAYVVLRRYELLPDASSDELVRMVRDEFVPIISTIPGFIDYALIEVDPHTHISLSVFSDQSAADASTQAAADYVAASPIVEMVTGPPEVTTGWVRVHAEAAPMAESTPTA